MRSTAILILLLCSTLTLAQQPPIPDTPAGRVLTAWLDAFNSGDAERVRTFHATYREKPEPIERMLSLREMTGGLTLLRIEKSEPNAIVALATEPESDRLTRIEFTVGGDPPKITDARVEPTPRPADLAIPRVSETAALAALSARVDELTAKDRFAGIVLIARNGKVLLQKSTGLANRDTKEPITADTKFRIGSMNKMFTATATLRLVEMGKVSLDDPIGKHLTGYPNQDVATKVTVRHLLSHRGGTGDIFGPDFTKNRLTLKTHADYLLLYGARGLGHEPGAEFRYSNYGFVLLGAIIERVSGMSYYDFVRRNVFEPAGMNATDSQPETEKVAKRSAGYMKRDGAWAPNVDTLPWSGTAAGGGYSTAGDLLKFAQALDSGTLLSKATFAEATTAQSTPMPGAGYGFGFGVSGEGALRSYGHNGGAPGMNGDLRIYPALGYVVVSLSNLDPPAASRLLDFFTLRMPATSAQQPTAAAAPPGTDIWLARLTPAGIEPPINITSRPGYDNQPSFTPDGKGLLFTRSDGKQTDIYLYDFTSRSSAVTPITSTPESEYSPTVTPDGQGMSVIRVEPDGTQRLWRFSRDGQSPTIVLHDVKPVGYHAWAPDGMLALFVLGANPNPNTLQVADSRNGRARVIAQRIGRSIHRIPGRDTISVLHIEGDVRTIKELDVKTRAMKPIVRAVESPDGDYAWTPDGSILMSNGKMLMRWNSGGDWTPFADLAAAGLTGASRMAVSPDGRWLALVASETRD